MNGTYIVPLVGVLLMTAAVVGVGLAAWRSHKQSSRLDFIRALGKDAEVYAEPVMPDRVQTPLLSRVFGPVTGGLRGSLSKLYPSSEIDNVHADLLKAGLTGSIRAEEFVAVQVGAVLLGFAAGVVMLVSGVVGLKIGIVLLLVFPIIGELLAAPSHQGAA
jgi:hypothetical protein